MKFVKLLVTTALFACFTGLAVVPSNAFEEQTSGTTAAPASKGTPESDPSKTPQSDLGSPSNIGDTNGGTVVRIPGLGTLGKLPKMDFGLELLYGAAETENLVDDSQEPNATTDDLRIRGTIKHQF